MFAAELRNRLLTAGHDLAAVEGSLTVDVARGGEQYLGIGGRNLALDPGDIHIRDAAGIISSVLHGPDERTRLVPDTRQALFCVYAPAGIPRDAVERHLADLAAHARLVAPEASVTHQQVHTAS